MTNNLIKRIIVKISLYKTFFGLLLYVPKQFLISFFCKDYFSKDDSLILSWRRFLSYRNQDIDLKSKWWNYSYNCHKEKFELSASHFEIKSSNILKEGLSKIVEVSAVEKEECYWHNVFATDKIILKTIPKVMSIKA